MCIRYIDGKEVTDGQWSGWCADDERGQKPLIRATSIEGYPFCITTPKGEPIRAYKQYKHAAMALSLLQQEFAS